MATLRSAAIRVCRSQDWNLSELSMIWSPDLPRFGSIDHLKELEQFCLKDEFEVLFIDPAYLCMPSNDTSNVFAQGELLSLISKLCQSMSVTLVLLHHCRKTSENARNFQPIDLVDIAWSGFGEFARQWILIGRRERFMSGTGENRLWLTIGGSAGHCGLYAVNIDEGVFPHRKWEVSVQGAYDAIEAQKADKERKRIEKETSRPLTTNAPF